MICVFVWEVKLGCYCGVILNKLSEAVLVEDNDSEYQYEEVPVDEDFLATGTCMDIARPSKGMMTITSNSSSWVGANMAE